jgi:hypothetical protein
MLCESVVGLGKNGGLFSTLFTARNCLRQFLAFLLSRL